MRAPLFLIVLFAVGSQGGVAGRVTEQPSTASPPQSRGAVSKAPWTPQLAATVLAAMRLNRQTFQEANVLKRYAESRPPATHPALVSCDLPRTATGAPAAQYPAKAARTTERTYRESAVVECLETTGGLDGTRARPLAQHYYCTFPGFSPDIRGCFTFQLRLASVSTARSAVDDSGFLPNGRKQKLDKGWEFLGTDPKVVPDVAKAFAYCTTDGRPHSITNERGRALDVKTIHPTPTRPTCWIAETQAEIFQGVMGGAIDPPIADQVALLKEYYDCDAIKGKVSAKRFKAFCEIDAAGFK